MEEKVFIAGFGGQGVVLAGNVLAYAALTEGKNILGMVSYGAEMRGGASSSSVVISEDEIDCPIIEKSTITIVLSQEAYDKFKLKTAKGGILFVNISEIKLDSDADSSNIVKIPATEIATEIGNPKVANLIMVGAVVQKTKVVKKESIISALNKVFSGSRKNLVYINELALRKGMSLISD